MTKFHINHSGKIAECKATKRKCSFGGDDLHFNNEKEAVNFVEETSKNLYGSNALLGAKRDREAVEYSAKTGSSTLVKGVYSTGAQMKARDEKNIREKSFFEKYKNLSTIDEIMSIQVSNKEEKSFKESLRIKFLMNQVEPQVKEIAESAKQLNLDLNNKTSKRVNPYTKKELKENSSGSIKDFAPLNEDTSLNRALFDDLQKYETTKNPLGLKTATGKLMEKMVHNQIIFSYYTKGELKVKKISIKDYSENFEYYSERLNQDIRKLEDIGYSKKEIDKIVNDSVNQHQIKESREKSIHDTFVKETKFSLINKLVELNEDDNPIVLKVSQANKASEIISLEKEIMNLKKKDEFASLGF